MSQKKVLKKQDAAGATVQRLNHQCQRVAPLVPGNCFFIGTKSIYCLDLTDVTLAFENANSKLHDIVKLHKLFHPTIPDGRTWSKLGENGEHGKHQPDDLKHSIYDSNPGSPQNRKTSVETWSPRC